MRAIESIIVGIMIMATISAGESIRPQVPFKIESPEGGVTLHEGLFKSCFDTNRRYLHENFALDDMLWSFRKRAGVVNPPGQPIGWERKFPAHAANFLAGAGFTLTWGDDPQLRQRLSEVVAALQTVRQFDGSLLIPGVNGFGGQWGYSWQVFVHGILAASKAGYADALLPMVRASTDYFNAEVAKRQPGFAMESALNYQGHVGSTRVALSPIGNAADIAAAERAFVSDEWVKRLAARDPEAVWKMPKQWPHCYEVVAFEGYLDHYRLTGRREFLDAMLGAWELFHAHWKHVGGTLAICEDKRNPYPPDSYPLTRNRHVGELCGSVFWIRFNHRFHRLFPDDVRYLDEIEETLYNAALAGQDPKTAGIRYHQPLEASKKDGASRIHTCCEGAGTALYADLPRYLYSLSEDRVSVNLYAASTAVLPLKAGTLTLRQETGFPFTPNVAITVEAKAPVTATLRLRVPGWASANMPILIDGKPVAEGKLGTLVELRRTWNGGERITFTLPMAWKAHRYQGENATAGHDRFAFSYGPILMALRGPLSARVPVLIPHPPQAVGDWARPVPGKPLHFTIAGLDTHQLVPYWELDADSSFTCYPAFASVNP